MILSRRIEQHEKNPESVLPIISFSGTFNLLGNGLVHDDIYSKNHYNRPKLNARYYNRMYDKIFNIMITLRDLREKFQTWSSTDIKNLISAKMKSKREPRDLKELYALADMINDLRASLDEEKLKVISDK